MKVQREQFQSEKLPESRRIEDLQSQVDALTAENMVLQEQLARKEQFNAMIAHELRSPLSPIISYAQMLARRFNETRGTKNDEAARNRLIQRDTNVIISQARRRSRLVNDLLDATYLSSNRFTLVRETCDLVALAQEIVEQLCPIAPYNIIALEAPQTAVTGNWDGGRLRQALGNLLDNAIKYSDEHTTITAHIWTTEDSAHVSVHNQGITIPPSDSGLLFRPYVRLAASSSREGSGLGLYITKSIIEAHGGTLRLEPPTEEAGKDSTKGTTFTFDLPLE